MSKIYLYLLHSRNKDNKGIENFKQRTKAILAYEEDEEKILKEFEKFAEEGVKGETSRLYSVNARNEEKVREEVIIRLLRDKISLTRLNSLVMSAALKKENKAESKWLFDFDVDDEVAATEFVIDVNRALNMTWDEEGKEPIFLDIKVEKYKTPNGYAIVVPHGFDTRELMEKWKDYDVTLKDIKVSNGAKFIKVYLGGIITMPGLSKTPSLKEVKFDNGDIVLPR